MEHWVFLLEIVTMFGNLKFVFWGMVLWCMTVNGMEIEEERKENSDSVKIVTQISFSTEGMHLLFTDEGKLREFIDEMLHENTNNLHNLVHFLCDNGRVKEVCIAKRILIDLEDATKDEELFDWDYAIKCNALLDDIAEKIYNKVFPLSPELFLSRFLSGFYDR